MLDFADRTGCGIFMVLWPQMLEIVLEQYLDAPLSARVSLPAGMAE